jgi:hypothetical protein
MWPWTCDPSASAFQNLGLRCTPPYLADLWFSTKMSGQFSRERMILTASGTVTLSWPLTKRGPQLSLQSMKINLSMGCRTDVRVRCQNLYKKHLGGVLRSVGFGRRSSAVGPANTALQREANQLGFIKWKRLFSERYCCKIRGSSQTQRKYL